MANTLSDLMANIVASPPVLNDVSVSRGRQKRERVVVTVAGTESAAHIFPLARLPKGAHIMGIKIANTDLGATLTADIGLRQSGDWAAGDQAVIDVDEYVDGVDLAVATTAIVEVLGFGGADAGVPPATGRPIYEDAGDTADTGPATYDLCLQIVTTGTPVAGSVVVLVDYTIGD